MGSALVRHEEGSQEEVRERVRCEAIGLMPDSESGSVEHLWHTQSMLISVFDRQADEMAGVEFKEGGSRGT
jgi:hypothetical protein